MPTFTPDTHILTYYSLPERTVVLTHEWYDLPQRTVALTFPLFGTGGQSAPKTVGQIWPRNRYDR